MQYATPHNTILYAELSLGRKTRHKAHINEHILTDAQEEILAKWVKVQGHRGIPMTYESVAQCAKEISDWEVGVSWPKQFLAHHLDLKMKNTTRLEKAHATALNPMAVDGFFDVLTEVIEEHDIEPKNMYNMDEKGIQLGVGARVTAMVD